MIILYSQIKCFSKPFKLNIRWSSRSLLINDDVLDSPQLDNFGHVFVRHLLGVPRLAEVIVQAIGPLTKVEDARFLVAAVTSEQSRDVFRSAMPRAGQALTKVGDGLAKHERARSVCQHLTHRATPLVGSL